MKVYFIPFYLVVYLFHGIVYGQKLGNYGEGEVLNSSGSNSCPKVDNSLLDLRMLPLLRKGVQTYQQCSYDRAGDNYDHEYFPLYIESNGELVIFDAFGPGVLLRQQMNIWHEDASNINIKYYFDGESVPTIDMDVSLFFSEKNPLGIFRPPFAYDGQKDFAIMYYPMYFRNRLKVTLTREPGGPGPKNFEPWEGPFSSIPQRRSHWYQYTYQLFTEDCGLPSWSESLGDQTALKEWGNADNLRVSDSGIVVKEFTNIRRGEAKGILNLSGKGSISELELKLEPFSRETLFNTWLKIYFDGEINPSVDAPLGTFFGSYPDNIGATYSTRTISYGAENGMSCAFPMPFWKSARVVIQNKSDVSLYNLGFKFVYDQGNAGIYPKENSGYFHAAFVRMFPRIEGYDYTYLRYTGQGHIVGHISQRWNTSMEENERTYFDGNRTPQIQGDGFEDDQGFGWGLKAHTLPFFGSPVANGGSGSLYRFFLIDPYVFYSEVKHGHQTYRPNSPLGHEGNYDVGNEQSVTFYYSIDAPGTILTDSLDIGNKVSEKKHNYSTSGESRLKIGTYWYDGEMNNILFKVPGITDSGRTFNEKSEFKVKIDPLNKGVRLRRRTDKGNNRQLARVFIDGQLITERPWYTVDYEETFRNIRWYDTNFEIPEKYTKGKDVIHIKLEYVSSKKGGIDEYFYWIYSYL